MNNYIKLLIVCVLLSAFCFSGCEKFVQITAPVDQISTSTVYSNDETASAVVRGIYVKMIAAGSFSSGASSSLTLFAGRSADDFENRTNDQNRMQFSDNNLLPTNTSVRTILWQNMYQIIYAANSVIENLSRSEHISPDLKTQLEGEALFIRAFCHFYLTNLFGNVPLILTTDYRVNSIAYGTPQPLIYDQIVKDLIEAKSRLKENYISTERIRANKWVATALLSRVYLYQKNWKEASNTASEVINQPTYSLLSNLDEVFLKNSQETLLQFAIPGSLGNNTFEGSVFVLTAPPGATTEVTLNIGLVKSFLAGDKRLAKWVGRYSNGTTEWFFPNKYKLKTSSPTRLEYSTVIRLAELYLIRAEAEIQLGHTEDGINNLNVLRKRADAPIIAAGTSKSGALDAVLIERRWELFSEWGHRWLDLKRLDMVNEVLAPLKGTNWQPQDVLYPIPATELINNKNLKQNDGYQ